MEIQRGDRVQVNVAPFIGSFRRHRESVPCSVLAVEFPRVQVRTESPYREVTLWVLSSWIEGTLESGARSSRSGGAELRQDDSTVAKVWEKAAERSPSLSVG